MKRILILVGIASCVIGTNSINWTKGAIKPDQATDATSSVFKIYVWTESNPTVPSEGTGFILHSTGNPQNPTLYLLTAAHVILGDRADDNTKLDVVEKVEVRFAGGGEALWTLNKNTIGKSITIAPQWKSTGKDFALIKILAAGKRYDPICFTKNVPETGQSFKAIGYLGSSPASLQVEGRILTRPGDKIPQSWMLVDAPLSFGMSGGPALSPEGVFAIIEGRREKDDEKLKFLVPLGLAEDFIRGLIPDWKSGDLNTKECIGGRILSLEWEIQDISGKDDYKTIKWDQMFTDIFWLDSEGWLCGHIEEGGGKGDVGRGILLHTEDGGSLWTEIEKSSFLSDKGTFTWGPYGNRLYSWTEVGPIKSLGFYPRHVGAGKYQTEGWLVSATGVYFSDDGGMIWKRITPPPDDPERYAFFQGFVGVEANAEIYAFGWQGIAHWSGMSRRWYLAKPTYEYLITGMAVMGGSENRSVWAVGGAGIDEQGNRGSSSHGAIYHLKWPGNRWEQVALPGISFLPGQPLTDILLVGYETVLSVGGQGLVLRGFQENGRWVWTKIPVPTQAQLNSIAYADGSLWVVGNDGVILESKDNGNTWARELVRDTQGKPQNLQRIRFFGEAGWIVGKGVVLKSHAPR